MEAVAPDRRLAGRYVLEELIATGGMASVWRARDEVLARMVAVKVLRPELAADPGFAERFQREAVAAARLTHPNIISVFDAGQDEGIRYIVMEHFEGATLRELLGRKGGMDPAQALELILPVLAALAFAHSAGLTHRDVKPANILVGGDGRVKVTDFGIAKAAFDTYDLTATGAVIGTARYLSPEQVHDGEVDGRSDLYSLGVVLYEMLTGRPPFAGENDLATAMMRLSRAPLPPSAIRPGIPADLETAVLRALARNPQDRFPSADAMRAALERHAGWGKPAATRAIPRTRQREAAGTDSTFRSWLLVPLVLIVLAGVVVAGGLAVGRLQLGGPLGIRPAAGETDEPPARFRKLAIAEAKDFDPQGNDRSEHPEEVPLAVDGDPSTAWETDHYNTGAFGGLKDGLGFWFELDGDPEVTRVTITSPIDGWAFQLLPGSSPESLSGPIRSVDGSTTFEIRSGEAVVDLEPARTSGVMIWIVQLGPDDGRFAAAISEVDLLGTG
ncbi:MAG: protein kinase domain-containing protein [Actinomycetota bacterium]